MSCNCVTNEQLKELYKKFGEKKQTTEGESIKHSAKRFFQKTGVFISMIIIAPFIFLYVFYKGIFSKNKKISLTKFFNLKPIENVG